MLAWLTDKIHRTDDRVDRLYAQSRTYVINSVKLEKLWVSLGEEASAEKTVGAQAGKVLAEEVAEVRRMLSAAFKVSEICFSARPPTTVNVRSVLPSPSMRVGARFRCGGRGRRVCVWWDVPDLGRTERRKHYEQFALSGP